MMATPEMMGSRGVFISLKTISPLVDIIGGTISISECCGFSVGSRDFRISIFYFVHEANSYALRTTAFRGAGFTDSGEGLSSGSGEEPDPSRRDYPSNGAPVVPSHRCAAVSCAQSSPPKIHSDWTFNP
jgi:hypothetical protein